jgi:Trk K+ transport system NAD-binding subunit
MSAYDFLVVGLGTVGSATCLELARRGHSVLQTIQKREGRDGVS